MASGIITSRQPQAVSPAIWTDNALKTVTNLKQFSYIYVVLTVSGNVHNRLDAKLIPVNTIDFTVTSNNAVWLYFEDTNSNKFTARLYFHSETEVGVSAMTSSCNVVLYGIR